MIDKEMKIEEIIRRYPQTITVLRRFGLDCSDCQIASYESLEHGAAVHKVDLAPLLKELNAILD